MCAKGDFSVGIAHISYTDTGQKILLILINQSDQSNGRARHVRGHFAQPLDFIERMREVEPQVMQECQSFGFIRGNWWTHRVVPKVPILFLNLVAVIRVIKSLSVPKYHQSASTYDCISFALGCKRRSHSFDGSMGVFVADKYEIRQSPSSILKLGTSVRHRIVAYPRID